MNTTGCRPVAFARSICSPSWSVMVGVVSSVVASQSVMIDGAVLFA